MDDVLPLAPASPASPESPEPIGDDTFVLVASPIKAAPRLSNRIVRLFSPHRRRRRRLVVSDHIPYLNFEQRVTKQQYRSRRKKLETGRGTGRKPKTYKNKPPELTEEEIRRICEVEIQSRWTPTERAKRAAGQVPDRLRFDTPISLGSH